MRARIITLIVYEALWFAVVIAAERGLGWLATGLGVAFTAWQIMAGSDRQLTLRVLGLAVLCGAAVDGGAGFLGFIQYAGSVPAPWPGGPPCWILGLWASFASTLPSAMRWLGGRPVWAAVLGAVGGPLSYGGAARGWHTVQFLAPAWHGYVWLAVTWGIALGALSLVTGAATSARPAAA